MLSDNNRPVSPRERMITGSFRDREAAERAFETLRSRGYSDSEIHIIMSDDTRKRLFTKGDEKGDFGNKALEGTAVGGTAGGVLGATITAIVAAGTTLAIPGLGLVIAGPLAGALAGGAVGAAAGGLVGMLVGAGIPEDRAKLYEQDLKAGHIVVAVKPRSVDEADVIEREWEMQGQKVQR